MKITPTVTIDTTPGAIAVVILQAGETIAYPFTCKTEAKALKAFVKRQIGSSEAKGQA